MSYEQPDVSDPVILRRMAEAETRLRKRMEEEEARLTKYYARQEKNVKLSFKAFIKDLLNDGIPEVEIVKTLGVSFTRVQTASKR